jgi:hypothetical protein
MRRCLSGVPAVAALSAVAVALATPGVSATRQVSDNWAGYVVTAPRATFTRVTGTWRQPRVSCRRGTGESAAAFWVGLGGSHRRSPALEQIGTSADCLRSGVAHHYAWYELVPEPMVKIGLKVEPGDVVTSSVDALDGATVEVRIENRTSGKSFRKTLPADPIDLGSAEWIAEAPSVCNRLRCYTIGLANFGRVAFSHAAVTGDGVNGTARDRTWSTVAVDLDPRSDRGFAPANEIYVGSRGVLGAALVGPLSTNGRAFTVQWLPAPET